VAEDEHEEGQAAGGIAQMHDFVEAEAERRRRDHRPLRQFADRTEGVSRGAEPHPIHRPPTDHAVIASDWHDPEPAHAEAEADNDGVRRLGKQPLASDAGRRDRPHQCEEPPRTPAAQQDCQARRVGSCDQDVNGRLIELLEEAEFFGVVGPGEWDAVEDAAGEREEHHREAEDSHGDAAAERRRRQAEQNQSGIRRPQSRKQVRRRTDWIPQMHGALTRLVVVHEQKQGHSTTGDSLTR